MSAGDRPRVRGVLPIVDVGELVPARHAVAIARALFEGGARVIQLRAKELSSRETLELARKISAVAREQAALFFVNDRPDIALLAGASGVHLGQTDLPAAEVRAWLPAHMLIGVSCHTPAQVEAVVREGIADYLGYGPVFATGTKKNADPVVGIEGLAGIARACSGGERAIDVVAIGGITIERLGAIRSAGVGGAAMISGLLGGIDAATPEGLAVVVERTARAIRELGV